MVEVGNCTESFGSFKCLVIVKRVVSMMFPSLIPFHFFSSISDIKTLYRKSDFIIDAMICISVDQILWMSDAFTEPFNT